MPTEFKNTLAEAKAAGAEDALNGVESNKTYYIEGSTYGDQPGRVNIDGKPLTMYFDGTVTFAGYNDQNSVTTYCVTENSTLILKNVRNNLRVYLAPNATLDLTQVDKDWEGKVSAVFQNPNAAIYLNSNSKVKAINLSIYAKATVKNEGGTIEADVLGIQDASILYNNGKIDVGTLITHNQDAEIINMNEVKATTFDMSAGGKYHNVGTTNITNATLLTNTNSWWKNEGQYTSGTFQIDNARRVYNNCKLKVNGNFLLKQGDFVLDAGASVDCQSFTFELNPDLWMNSKSLVLVAGEFLTKNFNKGYGIHGVGDQYAVIQAGSMTKEGTPETSMTYYGNLYIDTKNHYESGYLIDGSAQFSFKNEKSPVSIPKSDCSPGYEGNEDYDGRVMAEDLNATEASDFDYNDVVFDYKIDAANNKATIKLRAAGGIYPLTVGGVEVHAKFGFPDSYPMINTGAGTTATAEPYDYYFPTGVTPSAANIPVIVTKNGIPYTLEAPTGDAAAKFCVVTTCKWMKEKKFIGDAYSLFDGWVKDKTVQWTTTIKDASLLYNE